MARKIQAKLDSKLGPSVAIIPFLKKKIKPKPNCQKHQDFSTICKLETQAKLQTPRLCQSVPMLFLAGF